MTVCRTQGADGEAEAEATQVRDITVNNLAVSAEVGVRADLPGGSADDPQAQGLVIEVGGEVRVLPVRVEGLAAEIQTGEQGGLGLGVGRSSAIRPPVPATP